MRPPEEGHREAKHEADQGTDGVHLCGTAGQGEGQDRGRVAEPPQWCRVSICYIDRKTAACAVTLLYDYANSARLRLIQARMS